MAQNRSSFRVGRVRAFLRGQVWYLSYWEQGQRRQPRVGPQRAKARALAAEINGQLEAGAPSALGFEAIMFAALRDRWLEHHEHVRRSSLNTIGRNRSATAHLLDFTAHVRPLKRVSELQPAHVEEFIRFLRCRRVAPNGHRNARKRVLRDSGVKYVLETCSSLLNYAQRQRQRACWRRCGPDEDRRQPRRRQWQIHWRCDRQPIRQPDDRRFGAGRIESVKEI